MEYIDTGLSRDLQLISSTFIVVVSCPSDALTHHIANFNSLAASAELGLQAAIQSQRMAEAQLHTAKAMVAAREIVSPHDGIIVEIFKNAGEAIMVSNPIYKVVAIDRMRVTGYLDVGDAWHVHQGQAVRIMPEQEGGDLPIEREVFEGKITFVDSEIDPKTRTCRVFAGVENRDGLLRSGLECRMEIDLRNPSGTIDH